MLVNYPKTTEVTHHVKFVSYSGEYPNLCSGILVLNIDGKDELFGNSYAFRDQEDIDHHLPFWNSGGHCGFGQGRNTGYVESGEWQISVEELPDQFKKYASEIDSVFNAHVPFGCCGGCL